ncbi:hypothetical protein [Zobellia alginiliquefaciens]|uniref:hypothetical protein n=1 Tax=Zobellia alginiliquefaciens TaxID=3032586 RepID=UPI0023E47718|nr:hypothetical protein [Zobellia alginiliquefaciens]
MRKFVVVFTILLQSCLFGAGLVEQEITDKYWLTANNTLDEMSIWYFPGEHQSKLIVEQTVFEVGHNDNFIIAKSHPKDSVNGLNKNVTYYHIIEVARASKSVPLSLEQFEFKKKELQVSEKLEFTKVFHELK